MNLGGTDDLVKSDLMINVLNSHLSSYTATAMFVHPYSKSGLA